MLTRRQRVDILDLFELALRRTDSHRLCNKSDYEERHPVDVVELVVGAVSAEQQDQPERDLHHDDGLRNPQQVPEPHGRVMARPGDRSPHPGEQICRQNGDPDNEVNVLQIASFSTM